MNEKSFPLQLMDDIREIRGNGAVRLILTSHKSPKVKYPSRGSTNPEINITRASYTISHQAQVAALSRTMGMAEPRGSIAGMSCMERPSRKYLP
jgi:hypothetical protein